MSAPATPLFECGSPLATTPPPLPSSPKALSARGFGSTNQPSSPRLPVDNKLFQMRLGIGVGGCVGVGVGIGSSAAASPAHSNSFLTARSMPVAAHTPPATSPSGEVQSRGHSTRAAIAEASAVAAAATAMLASVDALARAQHTNNASSVAATTVAAPLNAAPIRGAAALPIHHRPLSSSPSSPTPFSTATAAMNVDSSHHFALAASHTQPISAQAAVPADKQHTAIAPGHSLLERRFVNVATKSAAGEISPRRTVWSSSVIPPSTSFSVSVALEALPSAAHKAQTVPAPLRSAATFANSAAAAHAAAAQSTSIYASPRLRHLRSVGRDRGDGVDCGFGAGAASIVTARRWAQVGTLGTATASTPFFAISASTLSAPVTARVSSVSSSSSHTTESALDTARAVLEAQRQHSLSLNAHANVVTAGFAMRVMRETCTQSFMQKHHVSAAADIQTSLPSAAALSSAEVRIMTPVVRVPSASTSSSLSANRTAVPIPSLTLPIQQSESVSIVSGASSVAGVTNESLNISLPRGFARLERDLRARSTLLHTEARALEALPPEVRAAAAQLELARCTAEAAEALNALSAEHHGDSDDSIVGSSVGDVAVFGSRLEPLPFVPTPRVLFKAAPLRRSLAKSVKSNLESLLPQPQEPPATQSTQPISRPASAHAASTLTNSRPASSSMNASETVQRSNRTVPALIPPRTLPQSQPQNPMCALAPLSTAVSQLVRDRALTAASAPLLDPTLDRRTRARRQLRHNRAPPPLPPTLPTPEATSLLHIASIENGGAQYRVSRADRMRAAVRSVGAATLAIVSDPAANALPYEARRLCSQLGLSSSVLQPPTYERGSHASMVTASSVRNQYSHAHARLFAPVAMNGGSGLADPQQLARPRSALALVGHAAAASHWTPQMRAQALAEKRREHADLLAARRSRRLAHGHSTIILGLDAAKSPDETEFVASGDATEDPPPINAPGTSGSDIEHVTLPHADDSEASSDTDFNGHDATNWSRRSSVTSALSSPRHAASRTSASRSGSATAAAAARAPSRASRASGASGNELLLSLAMLISSDKGESDVNMDEHRIGEHDNDFHDDGSRSESSSDQGSPQRTPLPDWRLLNGVE